MSKQIFMCKQCNGRGTVADWFFRIFTLGIGVLMGEDDRERQICPTCKGKGYLEFK